MNLKEYYRLYEDTSRQEEYNSTLKTLSNQTTSAEFFKKSPKVNGFYEKRKTLHNKIIKENINKYPTQNKPIIHFLLGSIGSGKTSIKDKIIEQEDKTNFLYINFDDIKLKLPEYNKLKEINSKKAAQFVQSESSKIAGNLFKHSIKKKINIIYEKNLRTTKHRKLHIIEEIKKAFKKNYTVYFHIVFLDSAQESWSRVQKRYKEIKRYVPKKDVESSFNSLFTNFNKILNTPFTKSYLVKIWYNSALLTSKRSKHKTFLIGAIIANFPKGVLNTLSEKNNLITLKGNRFLPLITRNRKNFLPKPAIKQLKKLDLFKKLD